MVSKITRYLMDHEEFYTDFYLPFFELNCKSCRFSGHQFQDDHTQGYCYRDVILKSNHQKREKQMAIGIYYHHQNLGVYCFGKDELDK